MGNEGEEPFHLDRESPIHEVTLSPFLIAKYETTQGEWLAIMGEWHTEFEGELAGGACLLEGHPGLREEDGAPGFPPRPSGVFLPRRNGDSILLRPRG